MVFIVFLSNNSVTKKGFIQEEIKIALDVAAEKKATQDIYIIPARLDDCPIPERLKHLQTVELQGARGIDNAYLRLEKAIMEAARGQPTHNPAPGSGSAEARILT